MGVKGVIFGAEVSFLVGALSVHVDVKIASLWTLMLMFQRFPVNGRLELWCFPGCP